MTPEEQIAELEARIAQQARTYTGLYLRISRLVRRVSDQQAIINWQDAQIDRLEAEAKPQAQAERHFKNEQLQQGGKAPEQGDTQQASQQREPCRTPRALGHGRRGRRNQSSDWG